MSTPVTIIPASNKDLVLVPGTANSLSHEYPMVTVKDVGMAGSKLQTSSGGSKLTWAMDDKYSIVVKGELIYMSTQEGTTFSITSSGGGTSTIKLPFANDTIKFSGDGKQVYMAPEDGSEAEKWIISS